MKSFFSTSEESGYATKIFLEDGSYLTVSYSPSTSCGELLQKLLQKLALESEMESYGLLVKYHHQEDRLAGKMDLVSNLNLWDKSNVDKIMLCLKTSPASKKAQKNKITITKAKIKSRNSDKDTLHQKLRGIPHSHSCDQFKLLDTKEKSISQPPQKKNKPKIVPRKLKHLQIPSSTDNPMDANDGDDVKLDKSLDALLIQFSPSGKIRTSKLKKLQNETSGQTWKSEDSLLTLFESADKKEPKKSEADAGLGGSRSISPLLNNLFSKELGRRKSISLENIHMAAWNSSHTAQQVQKISPHARQCSTEAPPYGGNYNISSLASYNSMEMLTGRDIDALISEFQDDSNSGGIPSKASLAPLVGPVVPERRTAFLENCTTKDKYLLNQGKRLSGVSNKIHINSAVPSPKDQASFPLSQVAPIPLHNHQGKGFTLSEEAVLYEDVADLYPMQPNIPLHKQATNTVPTVSTTSEQEKGCSDDSFYASPSQTTKPAFQDNELSHVYKELDTSSLDKGTTYTRMKPRVIEYENHNIHNTARNGIGFAGQDLHVYSVPCRPLPPSPPPRPPRNSGEHPKHKNAPLRAYKMEKFKLSSSRSEPNLKIPKYRMQCSSNEEQKSLPSAASQKPPTTS